MNKMKFFDKAQLILAISIIASFLIFVILFIIMSFTAEKVLNDDGLVDHLVYNKILENIYSMFVFIHLSFLTWFIARAITYSLRKKEYDSI